MLVNSGRIRKFNTRNPKQKFFLYLCHVKALLAPPWPGTTVHFSPMRDYDPRVANVAFTNVPNDERRVPLGGAVAFGKPTKPGSTRPWRVSTNVNDPVIYRRADSVGVKSGTRKCERGIKQFELSVIAFPHQGSRSPA